MKKTFDLIVYCLLFFISNTPIFTYNNLVLELVEMDMNMSKSNSRDCRTNLQLKNKQKLSVEPKKTSHKEPIILQQRGIVLSGKKIKMKRQ